jgi:AcrR family transcriptional regulator
MRAQAVRRQESDLQERAQRTRRSILQAAAEAFEAHGYGAARLRDITEQRHVSKGALYFHFPSKESLALALLQENDSLWPDLLEKLRPEVPRAMLRLIEFSRRVGELFRDDVRTRACIRLMLETTLRERAPRPPLSGWVAGTRELLAEAREQGDLTPGVDPDEAARFLVATFTGLQQMVIVDGGPVNPERCVAQMWRCVLPGLVAPDRLGELAEEIRPRRPCRPLSPRREP